MRRLSLVAIAVALPLAASCGSDSPEEGPSGCTEIGCTDGLSVAFSSASWPAGDYRLDVVADGLDYYCETVLPLDKDVPVTCSSDSLTLEVSGTELPPDQQAITGMHLSGLAEIVQVSLSRDGLPLATQTYYPTYETVQPNGPGCEPTCRSASGSLQL